MIRVLRPDPDERRDPACRLSPLYRVFLQIFSAVDCGYECVTAEARQIVIVLPGSSKTWLKHILSHLGAPAKATPIYVLCAISVDSRDDTYAGMAYHLAQGGHAIEVDLSNSYHALERICEMVTVVRAARQPLYHVLDRAFPGGIEAIVEIALRPAGKDHELIAYRPGRPLQPPISLAFGACIVGHLHQASFASLCENSRSSDSDRLIAIAQTASEIRIKLRIDPIRLTPLSMYLRGRRVSIVEDKLNDDNWAELLPALLGDPVRLEKLPPECRNYELGGITWSHYKDLPELLSDSDDLETCDVLLLDLASSNGAHPDGVISPMLRSHFVKLAGKLAQIREARDPEAAPLLTGYDAIGTARFRNLPRTRVPFPIVIGFTATQSGITTRTFLQDLAIDDFFFKSAAGPVHQRLHYYTLRQAIIGALERRAAWICYTEEERFRDWILQFDATERPTLLLMMESYRHYSAASMIRICCDALLSRDAPLVLPSCGRYVLTYLGRPSKSGATSLTLIAKALDLTLRLEGPKREGPKNHSVMGYHEYIASDASKTGHVVVFVDDFVGTGGQVEENLKKLFERSSRVSTDQLFVWFMVGLDTPQLRELVTGNESKALIAGIWHEIEYRSLKVSIRIEEIVPPHDISEDEERMLRNHCLITLGRDWEVPCQFEPFGWKNSRGLVSTFSNVPGNTLPIVWANGYINPWRPLRERFFNPFAQEPSRWEQLPECLRTNARCPLDKDLPSSVLVDGATPKQQRDTLGCNLEMSRRRHVG